MKKLYFLLILFPSFFCNAQKASKVIGTILLHPDAKESISIFDKPSGKIIKRLKHDLKEDDYLEFEIIGKNDSMFQVKANYAIKGFFVKGWIMKNNLHLGIYARNYSTTLYLYKGTSYKTQISAKIKKYYPDILHVNDCKNGWLFIEAKIGGKMYKGWMSPDMQCANAYTTCS